MIKKIGLVVCICSFLIPSIWAQKSKLADQYFRNGEYEKSSLLYKDLYKENRRNDYYFSRYLESMLAIEKFDEAESVLKQEIKSRPKDAQLYVNYGNLYEKQFKTEEADKQYRKAIKQVSNNKGSVSRLASAFLSLAKYDLAIEVYEEGSEKLDNKNVFAYQLGDLYRRKGEPQKMIQYYLLSATLSPNRVNSLKNVFQRYVDKEQYPLLQEEIFGMVQEYPDEIAYPELLQWLYVQQKDYKKALRQARALDRKLDENGSRVYELASIAQNAKAYDGAISAYQYIIDTKGPNTRFYITSKLEMLDCKRKKVTENFQHTQEELTNLENEYEGFLEEFGKNTQTVFLVIEYAKFQALYLGNIKKAIALLEEMRTQRGLKKEIIGNIKLDLGNYYLIDDNIWESTLLYSQVDKTFKEGILGERARYRNALLSYYNGDFEWSQQQFKILKSATTKLISNDAIDRSIFILDNLGLDTTDVPLKMYAEAELFMYQNKYDEAQVKLKEIEVQFPEHGLKDDLLYLRAQIYKRTKETDLAIETYEDIIENHKEEIRCDNALMELAELYHYQIKDLEKAQKLYEQLFLDFSSSTFSVEARKRFRIIRGDEVQ